MYGENSEIKFPRRYPHNSDKTLNANENPLWRFYNEIFFDSIRETSQTGILQGRAWVSICRSSGWKTLLYGKHVRSDQLQQKKGVEKISGKATPVIRGLRKCLRNVNLNDFTWEGIKNEEGICWQHGTRESSTSFALFANVETRGIFSEIVMSWR